MINLPNTITSPDTAAPFIARLPSLPRLEHAIAFVLTNLAALPITRWLPRAHANLITDLAFAHPPPISCLFARDTVFVLMGPD